MSYKKYILFIFLQIILVVRERRERDTVLQEISRWLKSLTIRLNYLGQNI